MMYVPRTSDQSMIRGLPRPVTESPFVTIQHDIDARADIVQREIEQLERVVTRLLIRRQVG